MTIDQLDGTLIAVRKPLDWTSHDVIGFLRKRIGIKTIGHCGTLDPFATGLLIVAIGRSATRTIDEWTAKEKTYRATIRFGSATDTDDRTGSVIETSEPPSEAAIRTALPLFTGEIQQLPPAFSAIKIGGKKAYHAARAGKPLELSPRPVTIKNIEWLEWNSPLLQLRVVCSKGTYIRSIARDLGKQCGSCGTLEELEREAIGDIHVSRAMLPHEIIDHVKADISGDYPFVLRRIISKEIITR